jgi:hypothetical protein
MQETGLRLRAGRRPWHRGRKHKHCDAEIPPLAPAGFRTAHSRLPSQSPSRSLPAFNRAVTLVGERELVTNYDAKREPHSTGVDPQRNDVRHHGE